MKIDRDALVPWFILASSLVALAYSLRALYDLHLSAWRLRGRGAVILSLLFTLFTGFMCSGYATSLHTSMLLARTNVASARLRELAKACIAYSDDHGEPLLPPHLAVVVLTKTIDPKSLLDPNARIHNPPLDAATIAAAPDWRSLAPAVDAHCDFVYVGAGLPNNIDSSRSLLYSKGRAQK
jgi:hypothetical protein